MDVTALMVVMTLFVVIPLIYNVALLLKAKYVPNIIRMAILTFGVTAMSAIIMMWLSHPEVNKIAGCMWLAVIVPFTISLYHISVTSEKRMPWNTWPQ